MLEFKLIYGIDGYNVTKLIREEVFMEEQGFSYDYDTNDDISWHVAGLDGSKIIAAARIFQKKDGIFEIGRVAVSKDYRHQYIGDTLLRVLEDKAVQLKGYLIEIGSREETVAFYEKEGYEATGESYLDDSHPHMSMFKDLTHLRHRCEGCQ